MQKYFIVIAKSGNNYSACSPDVLGCVATGATVEETLENIISALEFHFEGMVEDNEEIPQPNGVEYHIKNSELPLGKKYLFTEVEINIPAIA